MPELTMPHNDRAEMMLLAALLVDPQNFGECAELLPKEIYRESHRKVYESIFDHIENRLPVEAGLIASKLNSECRKVISDCLDNPGPSTDIANTVRQIKFLASRRRAIEIANAVIRKAQDDENADSTVEYAYRQFAGLSTGSNTMRGVSPKHIYNSERMVQEYMSYIKNLRNNRFITGIHEIDKRIRGVAGGEVLTILARAGSFKTALLQNLLTRYVGVSTRGAVMFSLEMPVASITERWFQILDGCSGKEVMQQFSDNRSSEATESSIKQFKTDLSRLFIVPAKIDLSAIPAYIKLIENEHNVKIGLIGVDYMQLIDCQGDSEYQQVSQIARGCKDIAKQVNLPLVMLSQVSRKGGDGEIEISLDMGRGSGAVEEAADFVLGLWQIEKTSCGMDEERKEYDLICRILKNRKGPKGSRWILDLDANSLRFGQEAIEYIPAKKTRKKGRGI